MYCSSFSHRKTDEPAFRQTCVTFWCYPLVAGRMAVCRLWGPWLFLRLCAARCLSFCSNESAACCCMTILHKVTAVPGVPGTTAVAEAQLAQGGTAHVPRVYVATARACDPAFTALTHIDTKAVQYQPIALMAGLTCCLQCSVEPYLLR